MQKSQNCDPQTIRKKIVRWYHNALCHLGEICAYLSIAQHLYGKNYEKEYIRFVLNVKRASF